MAFRTWLWAGAIAVGVLAGCSSDGGSGSGSGATGGAGASGGAGAAGGAGASGGAAGSATGGTATGGSATGGGSVGGSAGSSSGAGGVGGAGGSGSSTTPIKVVVLGSSTAAAKNLDQPAYGGDPSYKGWVALYTDALTAARPGSQVVSFAKAGASTYEALPTGTPDTANRPPVDPQRNITRALAESPDAILMNYPSGGDLEVGGYSAKEIVDNLHTIANVAQAANVPLWISTSQPRNLQTTTPETIALSRSLSLAVKSDFGARALDFWTPLTNSDGTANTQYQLTDGVHPNQQGHQLLFQVVQAANVPGVVAP
ncbi:MAG: SGNH/GDSL hydrolase family protein [Polyangiaceae bacterium]